MGVNTTTALRRSLPASQACQPASFELCFRIHVTLHTKQQTAYAQSIHPHQYQQHTPISSQSSFINSMKHIWINGSYGSGSGITRTLFFVVFMGNCYGFNICSPYIKSMWINIASKKSFQSIRSLSTQSSSQSHTRFIYFLIILLINFTL